MGLEYNKAGNHRRFIQRLYFQFYIEHTLYFLFQNINIQIFEKEK